MLGYAKRKGLGKLRSMTNIDKDNQSSQTKFKGKRLLILGGAIQHCKVVEAAKEMGIITYVTDFLPTAPAKEMADFSYQINVTETEKLAELCRSEQIDGIISGWLDFCQIPYQRLCEATGLPCYGLREQFDILTNKLKFKEICQQYGVGNPTAFPWKEYVGGKYSKLPYPVLVKPADSRGSRGVKVCYDSVELEAAIENASRESYDSNAIAERYIENGQAFLVVYFFVNGEAYVQQLSDAYFGDPEYGLGKVVSAYRSPAKSAELYFKHGDSDFISMLKDLGVKDGPVCMQGFLTENEILYFDPGRRFPGGEYERAFKRATGIDFVKLMIGFALTGEMCTEGDFPRYLYRTNGKTTLRLHLNVRGGLVASEEGFEDINNIPEVEYVAKYHGVGDMIENTGDVRQRYAHIVIVADTTFALQETIRKIYSVAHVFDSEGKEMLVSYFPPEIL